MSPFDGGPGFGFNFMFTLIPFIVFCGFVFVIGSMVVKGVKYAGDKTLPIIPAHAKIVSKRTQVWGDHSHTTYYATFELDNGQRVELSIPDREIGYLAEGDVGTLSFQGEIFVGFERG